MAAVTIRVSQEEFETTISKYETAQGELEQAFNALREARESLDNCWEGMAKQTYTARWNAIYQNLVQANSVVERTLEGLRNAEKTYFTAETEVRANVQGLDEGSAAPTVF